jgi:tRNA G18 (ribose-2'-O)-methylase SpoU
MSAPILIEDPADPRIAAYRNIRERDLVGREGLFIAEGEVVVRVLLTRSLHTAVSLLVSGKHAETLAAIAPRALPVFVAPQPVLDAIAGFHLHRGILALGRANPAAAATALLAALPPRATVVVLFGIANHDNMGGIFRNAAAFGADAVILDAACCDPLYRKAIRVSVGSAFTVPFARLNPDEDAIALLRSNGFTPLALSPRGTTALSDLDPPPRAAGLFGTEGPGLPDEIISRAETVRIEMPGAMDSLNVATASGIVLHHLANSR